jgi:voltage-gated potassium channel
MIIPFDFIVLKAVRVIRLVQIFKLSRYTSSSSSIWFVIKKKSSQLISSMLVIFMLITIVSLIMYSVENPAQPKVFKNALSGIWWAIETLTTVGYGDNYPITSFGKFLASIISLLGIGLIAVPTAIISTGFIEQMESKNPHEDFLYCPHCGKKLR